MRYLRSVAGKIIRKNDLERIRGKLKISPLKTTPEKRQFKLFGHVCRKCEGQEPRKVIEVRPTGKRPRGSPKILYQECIEMIQGKTQQ